MNDLHDRVVLVTGAGGALGGVVARRLLDSGARVALFDRQADRPPAAIPELAGEPARAAYFACDLADSAAVDASVGAAVSRFGRLDAALNIAGTWRPGGDVETTTEEAWRMLWEANFVSALNVCRAVLPIFKRQGSGAIVNVGSKASLAGGAGASAYSVAKTAVLRLTESIAEEGKAAGVRANLVLPGTIDTAANRKAMPDADTSLWVAPEALADVVLFLASDLSRAVTGAAIPVFGKG